MSELIESVLQQERVLGPIADRLSHQVEKMEAGVVIFKDGPRMRRVHAELDLDTGQLYIMNPGMEDVPELLAIDELLELPTETSEENTNG